MICKQKLYKAMDRLGYPESLSGTRYIQSAAALIDANRRSMMCKDIYPAIAQAAGSSSARVERAMRAATEAAMRNPRFMEEWREMGGWSHPTNSEVCHRLARESRIED